jgi:predicted DNA-binding antitoxin AbrB/MazE fold protein
MVTRTVITVDAFFENGVLRPVDALPFRANERVTVRIDVPSADPVWPADTAEIYSELEAEDRALANRMFPTVSETWPHEGVE